jgi:acetyltransferase-like isoleucine patch superfamily enzyme
MYLINNLFFMLALRLLYIVGYIRASFLGVRLGSGARIHPRADIKLASYIGNAQIAKSVIMNEGSYINSGIVSNAQIGKFVSIAYNVIIGPTEHNTKLPSMSPHSPLMKSLNISTDLPISLVIIEDEVWIGANTVILQGVKIGHGSVIAAGAVVTKDVPSMEIWGGVPARKIKNRVIENL